MLIRKVTSKDNFDVISQIYALSWKSAYQGIVSQTYLDNLSERRWTPFLEKETFPAIVAIVENTYVGTSSYSSARENTMETWGEIISIYVLPQYQGKGIGRFLLDKALSELLKMGYKKVYLWVLLKNYNARKFYEKNGFVASNNIVTVNIENEALQEIRYTYTKN